METNYRHADGHFGSVNDSTTLSTTAMQLMTFYSRLVVGIVTLTWFL